MDILYIIGRGSRWQNNELRFSLRSIERYGIGVGRVYVVGYLPPFLNRREVTMLEVPDISNHKHVNILNCIEKAVEMTNIGDDFLLSSDDHFYLRATDFNQYPFYRKGALPSEIKEADIKNNYRMSLYETHTLLSAAGLTTHNFSQHGNTHFRRSLFCEPRFRAIVRMAQLTPHGCEPTCLMLNYWLSRQPFTITDRSDNKFGDDVTKGKIESRLTERECLSTNDNIAANALGQYLMQTFKQRSRYEQY